MPIYIVVGAPRSGTSAFSLALREQGVRMFLASDSPDLDSPSGNQEDNLARLVNNQLMGRKSHVSMRDWDNPTYVAGAPPTAVRTIRAYVAHRSRHARGAWGVKDPRIAFLIEAWHAATRDLPVRWIQVHREDRQATIRSLVKMLPAPIRTCGDRAALERLVSNWSEAYRLAIDLGFARTAIKPMRISYERLLTPAGQIRIAEQLGFEAPIRCIRPALNRQAAVGARNRRPAPRFPLVDEPCRRL